MAEKQPPNPPNPPRRPKRVSLKGRGADIFFGDYTPPGLEGGPRRDSKLSPQHDVIPSNYHDSEQSRQDDSLLSNYHDSDPPIHQDSMLSTELDEGAADYPDLSPGRTTAATTRAPTSRPVRSERRPAGSASPAPVEVSSPGANAIPHPELPSEAWAHLDEPATIANTFRYTEEELAALNDAIYQVGKKHKVRVTKQDAVRLGLYFVLEDYRRRGLESLLGQLAENRQHTRKTGGH